MHETNLRFATRLNSFGSRPDAYWPKGHGKPSPLELAERASKAEGLTDVDLNYPDHVGSDPRVTGDADTRPRPRREWSRNAVLFESSLQDRGFHQS